MSEEARSVAGMLRGRGYRITPQREAILEEVLATRGHITPQDVARRVQRRMPAVNPSTVYRTMTMLEAVGVVRHAHLEGGAEYHRTDHEEHVHLTCSRCGAEDDLSMEEAESLKGVIRRHHGFLPDLAHFAISGLCASCQRAGRGSKST
ncbi:MAG: Fur family transcriptional regulator [Actinomycetota bacterium]|jgi:Fur family ferric uptake transcriptional regulator